MSFINLLDSVVYTDADITSRTLAILRESVSADDELKAARIARKATPTQQERAYVASVDAAIETALHSGAQARADMALLSEVLAFEAGGSEPLSSAAQAVFDLRHPVRAQA